MDVCIENLFPAVAMPFNPFQKESPDGRDDAPRPADHRRRTAASSVRIVANAAPADADALFASVKAETADPELLNGHLEYLCERLGAALRASGKQARTIGVQIRFADRLSVRQTARLTHASSDDGELLVEAEELLASALRRRIPVLLLGLSVTNLALCAQQQSQADAEAALAAA